MRTVQPIFRRWVLTLACLSSVGFSAVGTSDELTSRIRDHFQEVVPEFQRYSRISRYGETLEDGRISPEAADQEWSLYETMRGDRALEAAQVEHLSLCHNILIHQPTRRRAVLEELYRYPDAEAVRRYIPWACLVTEELGEETTREQLRSNRLSVRRLAASCLAGTAVYQSSIDSLQAALTSETDDDIRANLLHALAAIGDQTALLQVQETMKTCRSDRVQSAAIFAFVELAGHSGLQVIEHVIPVGPLSEAEKSDGAQWLRAETTAENPFGTEVVSDLEFVQRFGDLAHSPAIQWLRTHDRLSEDALNQAAPLTGAECKELLVALTESKGFGLEAVKGALLASVSAADEPALLRLRAVAAYSPNAFTTGRLKTIGILLRHVRRLPK